MDESHPINLMTTPGLEIFSHFTRTSSLVSPQLFSCYLAPVPVCAVTVRFKAVCVVMKHRENE